MKTVLLAFFLSVIVAAQCFTKELEAKISVISKECIAATNIDPEVVAQARKGNFMDEPKLKQYLYCASKKLGLQNEAGEPQIDALRAPLARELQNEAEADRVITKCIIVKDTPEQTAYDFYKCGSESTPNHMLVA